MSFKFRRLVNRHEHRVFSLALYILGDRAEAEDVAQETYMKLWENLDQVDGDTAKFWLLRVTRNACVDRLRRRRTQGDVTESPAVVTDHHQEPAGALVREQLSGWLREAIEKLSEPYKSLIVLRDLQQNSYEDIAAILSLSLSQVKVYLHRARKQLRDSLRGVEI